MPSSRLTCWIDVLVKTVPVSAGNFLPLDLWTHNRSPFTLTTVQVLGMRMRAESRCSVLATRRNRRVSGRSRAGFPRCVTLKVDLSTEMTYSVVQAIRA